jgi:TrkA domain protein
MQVKTSDLPGIGKRYSIITANREQVVVIMHHHGHREIYHFTHPDEDEPDYTLSLNDEEARQLGTILMGVDYQPVADERVEMLLKSIRMEWLKVESDSCVANTRIIDSRIRSRTGATVVGIQRGDSIIGSPDVTEVIRPGDVLMVIGTRQQTRNLESLCHLAEQE